MQPSSNRSFPRRRFLHGTAATAATLAAGFDPWAMGADSAPEAAPAPPPSRPLGRTGMRLPRLAYGGTALPRRWGNPLSYDRRIALVRHAHARGLRYFDTAGNYMESQDILGRALEDLRQEVFLTTKIETTDPARVRPAVERCLSQLRTDHADALLIHGTPGLQQMSVAQAMRVHSELRKLREEKLCRFIGFSAHGYFDKALALIRTGGFDLCMLAYGYIPRGYDQLHSPRMQALRDACLAEARARGMGIVAMKVIGAGLLGAWARKVVPDFPPHQARRLPAAAIRWVLQDDRVDLLCIGMRTPEEIDANLRVLHADPGLSAADREVLADYCAQAYETEALKRLRLE
ncbi:MAG: aldo/keto reductase [Verrucomicrobia bacterium]|nr:MAG: aldo/keto reductase [Verrucomicrobiota bacterium]